MYRLSYKKLQKGLRIQDHLFIYRPQTKLRDGYVFTGVCDSVHRGGGIPACVAGLQGGVSQHTLQVSRPTPKGGEDLRGLAGGMSPGPHPGGGGVSQHALRQTPQLTATAAGGTHPTGMHSCCAQSSLEIYLDGVNIFCIYPFLKQLDK